MKNKIVVICSLLICMSCVEHTHTLAEDSSIDITIGNFEEIYSFSMTDSKKAFVMIQKTNEITKVYNYNFTEEEKDRTKILIDKAIKSFCKESEGLSRKDDYFMALKQSDTNEYFYTSENCNNLSVLQNLKNYLVKTFINSKPMLLFESTNNLVLPPPLPLPEISLDSVKFFNNDK